MKAIDLLLEGVQTRRFHSVSMIQNETVAHHSALVAGFLFLVYPDCSREVLIHAAFHDIAECKTGDIPSPSKRAFIDKKALDLVEDKIYIDNDIHLPELNKIEKYQLKIADILAGLSTCLHEKQMGNTLVDEAFTNFSKYFIEKWNENTEDKKALKVYTHIQNLYHHPK